MNEPLRIVLSDEVGTSHRRAEVSIYYEDKLYSVITTHIEYEQGADGGFYPCIKLTESRLVEARP